MATQQHANRPPEARIQAAAAEILTQMMEASDVAIDPLSRMLDEIGQLPAMRSDTDDATFNRRCAIVESAVRRMCSHLRQSGALVDALRFALSSD